MILLTFGKVLKHVFILQGGVCIFISNKICFDVINLDQFIKEKDLEICALKICLLNNSFKIICIYRSPTGDFSYFLNQLESILKKIFKTSTHIILCGDFNINYLDDNPRKNIFDSLLASFGLLAL
jgi:exonuclease III